MITLTLHDYGVLVERDGKPVTNPDDRAAAIREVATELWADMPEALVPLAPEAAIEAACAILKTLLAR